MLLQLCKDKLKAATTFRRALSLDPGHVSSSCNLASVLAEEGDVQGAVVVIREALKRHPDEADLLEVLGELEG